MSGAEEIYERLYITVEQICGNDWIHYIYELIIRSSHNWDTEETGLSEVAFGHRIPCFAQCTIRLLALGLYI